MPQKLDRLGARTLLYTSTPRAPTSRPAQAQEEYIISRLSIYWYLIHEHVQLGEDDLQQTAPAADPMMYSLPGIPTAEQASESSWLSPEQVVLLSSAEIRPGRSCLHLTQRSCLQSPTEQWRHANCQPIHERHQADPRAKRTFRAQL